MSGEIIDLFTGKVIRAGLHKPGKPVESKGTGSESREGRMITFDPCNMWSNFMANHDKFPVPYEIVLRHEVYLPDICKAVILSGLLTRDREALDFYLSLTHRMASLPSGRVILGDIPEQLRGYVWSPSWEDFSQVRYFAEHNLPYLGVSDPFRVIVH